MTYFGLFPGPKSEFFTTIWELNDLALGGPTEGMSGVNFFEKEFLTNEVIK